MFLKTDFVLIQTLLASAGRAHIIRHDEHNRHPNKAAERGPGDPIAVPRSVLSSQSNIRCLQNHVVTLEITSGQVYRGKLIEGTPTFPPYPPVIPRPISFPHPSPFFCYGAQLLTNSSLDSRRQYERPTQRHHRHCARRPSQPSRSGLHQRESCAVFHCAGYVEVRKVVVTIVPGRFWKQCTVESMGIQQELT